MRASPAQSRLESPVASNSVPGRMPRSSPRVPPWAAPHSQRAPTAIGRIVARGHQGGVVGPGFSSVRSRLPARSTSTLNGNISGCHSCHAALASPVWFVSYVCIYVKYRVSRRNLRPGYTRWRPSWGTQTAHPWKDTRLYSLACLQTASTSYDLRYGDRGRKLIGAPRSRCPTHDAA